VRHATTATARVRGGAEEDGDGSDPWAAVATER